MDLFLASLPVVSLLLHCLSYNPGCINGFGTTRQISKAYNELFNASERNRCPSPTTLQVGNFFKLVTVRITGHLIYWGKARVIGILSTLNTYILNPSYLTGDATQFIQEQDEFNKEFPNFDYCEILGTYVNKSFPFPHTHRFSFPRKLGEHIEHIDRSLETQFIDVVCWLIRHNLLVLLRTYIFLILPG